MTFQEYLDARIDAQDLTPELRRALLIQWQSEQPTIPNTNACKGYKPTTVIVIGDDIEERWSRAVRMEVPV